jgi:hypothetical protein
LDEKIDEKIDPCKSDKSPLGYQLGIEFFKTNILPIGIYKISKIVIPSWYVFDLVFLRNGTNK